MQKLLKISLLLVVSSHLHASAVIDKLPDYSVCGYHGGGMPLPEAPVRITLSPGKGGDDTARIQKALDKVGRMPEGENGVRGAVMLTKGTYRVSGTLNLFDNGVTLKGHGQGSGGTLIIATGKTKRSLIMVGERAMKKVVLAPGKIAITNRSFTINTTVLQVANTSNLKAGDGIVVFLEPKEKWIKDLGMDKLKKPWTAKLFIRQYERRVTSVSGNSITLNVAIPENYNQQHYAPAYIKKIINDKRVVECGVEDLRLISEYCRGRENSDEQHAWTAVQVANAKNCWIKNITTTHFGYSGVYLAKMCTNITVQDCACLEPASRIVGARRYAFLCKGQQCLVQRCFARRARHSFVTNWMTHGPNVFLDCIAVKALNDSGPHSCWITGTLYDNLRTKDGALNIQNRGCMGGCHGWAGASEVLWNCEAETIILEKPPTARNYAIGCVGRKKTGHTKKSQSGYWESHGKHVKPRSLYLYLLKKRLGDVGVNAVAMAEQKGAFPLKAMEKSIIEPDPLKVNLLINPELVLKNGQISKWRGNAYGGGQKKAMVKAAKTDDGGPCAIFYNDKASCIHVFQYMKISNSSGKCHVRFRYKAAANTGIMVKLSLNQNINGNAVEYECTTKESQILKADGRWQTFRADFKVKPDITGNIVLHIKAMCQEISLADAVVREE